MKTKVILLAATLALTACGVPARNTTIEQRNADLEWLFNVFDRNYAPLELKERLHGFTFNSLKEECFEKNKLIPADDNANHAFRALAFECVSRFQDAHTRVVVQGSVVPGQAKVAYLGFMTERTQKIETKKIKDASGNEVEQKEVTEALIVKKFLPTTKESQSDLKKNDLIVKINGLPVEDYLRSELTRFDNTGQDSTNLTEAASKFALRNSMQMRLPIESDVVLSVERSESNKSNKFDVTVPWTVKDLFDFGREQTQAAKDKKDKTKAAPTPEPKKEVASTDDEDAGEAVAPQNVFTTGALFDLLIKSAFKSYTSGTMALDRIQFLFRNTFQVLPIKDLDAAYRLVESLLADGSGDSTDPVLKEFNKIRELPTKKGRIESKSFVAFELPVDGKRYLYIQVPSFSIGDEEVKEFGKLVIRARDSMFDGILLDMLDNGGGSLVHGLRMLSMLSSEKVALPSIQLRLNDSWITDFKTVAYLGDTDVKRTWGARITQMLEEDMATGSRLSRVISTGTVDATLTKPKSSDCDKSDDPEKVCLPKGIKLVLVVNEMCASMCDIFASGFKDNKLGVIAGSKTMGAGGNVVSHGLSPVSLLMVNQTESLIVDANGQYVENNGVVPGIELETVPDRHDKFKKTIEKSLELFKEKKPESKPLPETVEV